MSQRVPPQLLHTTGACISNLFAGMTVDIKRISYPAAVRIDKKANAILLINALVFIVFSEYIIGRMYAVGGDENERVKRLKANRYKVNC